VNLTEHEDLAAYRRVMPPGRAWLFSARATRTLYEVPIQPGDHLVFGRESVGLPQDLLDAYPEQLVTIPLRAGERSLNLSNAVTVAVYENVRKMIGSGAILVDTTGRLGVSSPEL
jgi:tRNA (cytidine/uridine-2'-O-)-methyltransferase